MLLDTYNEVTFTHGALGGLYLTLVLMLFTYIVLNISLSTVEFTLEQIGAYLAAKAMAKQVGKRRSFLELELRRKRNLTAIDEDELEDDEGEGDGEGEGEGEIVGGHGVGGADVRAPLYSQAHTEKWPGHEHEHGHGRGHGNSGVRENVGFDPMVKERAASAIKHTGAAQAQTGVARTLGEQLEYMANVEAEVQ